MKYSNKYKAHYHCSISHMYKGQNWQMSSRFYSTNNSIRVSTLKPLLPHCFLGTSGRKIYHHKLNKTIIVT